MAKPFGHCLRPLYPFGFSRARKKPASTEEYAEAMENKAKFPAIVVFHDGIDHGFHRVHAAKQAGRTSIAAEIRSGSLADAQWYSFGVNKTHGLRRTNEDKRRAVEGALEHEKGSGRTNEVIAEHCGVDNDLVRSCREKLESRGGILAVSKRVGKDGKVYDIEKQATSHKRRAKKTTTTTTTVYVEEALTDGLGRPDLSST
jgi:hypothetical protein